MKKYFKVARFEINHLMKRALFWTTFVWPLSMEGALSLLLPAKLNIESKQLLTLVVITLLSFTAINALSVVNMFINSKSTRVGELVIGMSGYKVQYYGKLLAASLVYLLNLAASSGFLIYLGQMEGFLQLSTWSRFELLNAGVVMLVVTIFGNILLSILAVYVNDEDKGQVIALGYLLFVLAVCGGSVVGLMGHSSTWLLIPVVNLLGQLSLTVWWEQLVIWGVNLFLLVSGLQVGSNYYQHNILNYARKVGGVSE